MKLRWLQTNWWANQKSEFVSKTHLEKGLVIYQLVNKIYTAVKSAVTGVENLYYKKLRCIIVKYWIEEFVENLQKKISTKYKVYTNVQLSTNLTLISWFIDPESAQLNTLVEIMGTTIPLNIKFSRIEERATCLNILIHYLFWWVQETVIWKLEFGAHL
jgi:hypothetical protein